MSPEQVDEVQKMVQSYTEPVSKQSMHRPALLVKTGSDGALFITPQTFDKSTTDICCPEI